MDRKYDLQERLSRFTGNCIDISELLPKTAAGRHMADQLVRSATSPTLNYGEAQAAESRTDFIHKMKVCLKELRETLNCLTLIRSKRWVDDEKMAIILKENNELISIFFSSIRTAQINEEKEKSDRGNV
ncbi:MAG TPA: four helix bundle protein [Chitinophagaceae bacterium]|jgi:four helix bundle protein|nr:four helix bundle protein [Chitinophagaceae bacterium]